MRRPALTARQRKRAREMRALTARQRKHARELRALRSLRVAAVCYVDTIDGKAAVASVFSGGTEGDIEAMMAAEGAAVMAVAALERAATAYTLSLDRAERRRVGKGWRR